MAKRPSITFLVSYYRYMFGDEKLDIVAIIPARSGSKGVLDKNIKNLCGRPLMSYAIEAALGCDKIKDIFLNSDNQAYLDIGLELGVQPFLRSEELAKDDTPMNSVIINFIDCLEKQGKFFDTIVVLYPVYPLRNSDDLTRMITEFEDIGGNRPLVGMKAPDTHPYLCYNLNEDNVPQSVIDHDPNNYYRRQTYPKCFEFNLWACVLPVHSLSTLNAQLMNKETYGYIIPNDIQVVDIDTPSDFEYAEFLLQKKYSQCKDD